jgi:hypothetical protein
LKLRFALFVAALLMVGASGAAAAQSSTVLGAMHHRNNCRIAGQVLATDQPANRVEWAASYVGSCPNEGPAWLVTQWQKVSSESEAMQLVHLSSRFRDDRLYNTAIAIARDKRRPEAARIGSVLLLARFANPANALTFDAVRPPAGLIGEVRSSSDSNTGAVFESGAEPLRENLAVPIVQALDAIAANRVNEPTAVWYAAAAVAQRIRGEIADGIVR